MMDAIAFDLVDAVPLGTEDDAAFGAAFDLVDAVLLGTEDDTASGTAFGTGAGVALLVVFRLMLPPQSGHALRCSSFFEPVNKAPFGILTKEHTQFGVAHVGVGVLKMAAIKAALGSGGRFFELVIDMSNSGEEKKVGENTKYGCQGRDGSWHVVVF